MLLGMSSIYANIRTMPAPSMAIDKPLAASRALPAFMAAVELPFGIDGFSCTSTHQNRSLR
jgi:hypothetical protein